jgi:hypothetical protein
MRFTLTEDQVTLETALDGLVAGFSAMPTDFRGFVYVDPALEQAVEENGFFDIATIPELGPVSAALAVEKLAQLPCTGEFALSMLVRPALDPELPRPFALVEDGRPGRFVVGARTVVVIDGEAIRIVHPGDGDATPCESILAYPMGRLRDGMEGRQLEAGEAESARGWLRVALAAEMSGLIHGGLQAVVDHVSVRKQFGRELGTFQALRHRLSEVAVLAGGVRLLALRAAGTGDPGDAAIAAFHAQESGTRAAYEFHQMLGAMGMTLEHPLHLWTYRIKALLSELGGRAGQAGAVGRYCF